jgi:F-type H+-transporting ATPase subunit delta
VIDQVVAKRYAQALFGAAQAGAVIEPLLSDLESLEALMAADTRLLRFFESPRELDESKRELVSTLFKGRTTDLFLRFLLLLLKKKRVAYLLDVSRTYRKLVEDYQGVAEARVTTAVPMPEDLKKKLQQELERLFGKKVRIRPRIDPRIIGGLFVVIEQKIIDRSIRSELEKLRDDLLGVRIH